MADGAGRCGRAIPPNHRAPAINNYAFNGLDLKLKLRVAKLSRYWRAFFCVCACVLWGCLFVFAVRGGVWSIGGRGGEGVIILNLILIGGDASRPGPAHTFFNSLRSCSPRMGYKDEKSCYGNIVGRAGSRPVSSRALMRAGLIFLKDGAQCFAHPAPGGTDIIIITFAIHQECTSHYPAATHTHIRLHTYYTHV